MFKRPKKMPALISVFIAVFTLFFVIQPNNSSSECFLWKVKINESIFYLAGSIHAAKAENYPLPKDYEKKYKSADKVIFELAEDFDTIEKQLFQYTQKDKLPETQYLNQHLSAECIEKLENIFDKESLNSYFKYEVWVLNMAIAGKKSKLIGYDPTLAVDNYFHDLARADNKTIIGLDSLNSQIELFEFDVPFETQLKIIENAIQNMEIQAKNEAPLYKSYFENNIKEFEAEFTKPYSSDNPKIKQMYDLVFTNRNRKWVNEFERLSIQEPGKYFVLVGTGHYFGDNNIRELLEEKGYLVQKI